ncbi:hypothetical protein BOFL111202_03260 [Bordetella flabilis]
MGSAEAEYDIPQDASCAAAAVYAGRTGVAIYAIPILAPPLHPSPRACAAAASRRPGRCAVP